MEDMKLSEFCIQRPVLTIVLSLVLVVIGIVGYLRLPIRDMPNVNYPVVSIRTEYSGASAALIESQITTPIEQSLATINGLYEISSDSQQDISQIRVRFNLGVDIDQAAIDIQNNIAPIIKNFPEGVETPIIQKADFEASEALILSIHDNKMSSMELADYVNRYVIPQFEELPGVANVDLMGDKDYAMRIWLDPWMMAKRQVTVGDVINSLRFNIQNQPGGQIQTGSRYYSILTQSQLSNAKQFNDLIIRNDHGYLVKISDVGKAQIGPKDYDSAFRVDGKSAVGISLIAQSDANPITVAKIAEQAVKDISKTLPTGMKIKVVYNNADYVHAAMKSVIDTVLEAIILVVIVTFLFLGSWRSSFIPIVTIPVCLIAVFGFLYFINYSINFMSMLAVVLAIGLVVDDAIVMLENIYRHIEEDMLPMQAALMGSQEIGFSIIAMTLTLAAVYTPIGFAQGFTGIIFRQFGFTLAMAVIISGFVALTLSPMMCARLLSNRQAINSYTNWLDQYFHKLIDSYQKLLKFVIHWRFAVLLLLILLGCAGYFLYENLPKELAPQEDYGFFMTGIQGPVNASFKYTNYYAKQIEGILSTIPEEIRYVIWVGGVDSTTAFSYVILKPWSERQRSAKQIMADVQNKLNKIPGVEAGAMAPAALGGNEKNSGMISFSVMTTGDYEQLNQVVKQIEANIKQYPGLENVDSSLKINDQQFDVSIKHNIAAELGVNVKDIDDAIATLLGGNNSMTFSYDNYNYDVIVQLNRRFRGDFDLLNQLYVRNTSGNMIPLSNLITIKSITGSEDLPHYNRMRSADLNMELTSGYTIDQAVTYLQTMLEKNLPSNAKYAFRGEAKHLLESRNTMDIIFVLALLFIYLIMAAQFESFIDPLIILFGVPLAIVGGLFTLKLSGCSLNIFSKIGLVTLIGLIAKHGILITNFANQLREQGMELNEALIKAATLRVRPILMTTAAMVIGALPLALSTGAGAHGRQAIGWVIVGGLIFGTFFSLFVVPVGYSYLGKFRRT